MARSRNIKPGLFQNELLAELPFETRLLFAGLPCFADRDGRLEDRPRRIKMGMFPADSVDVDSMLRALHDRGFITRYAVDDAKYIQIVNFQKHQMPHHKEAASVIPAPVGHKDSGAVPSEVTPGQRQRILDRDGHKCLRCGGKERLHVDHIVPVSKGGTSEDHNLQILCVKCNSAKGNRHTQRFNDTLMSHKRPVNEPSIAPNVPLIPDSLNLVTDSLQKPSSTAARFDAFWAAYPKKVERKKASAIWKRRKLDDQADEIIRDIQRRQTLDRKWLDGFIQNPTTYLNGDRWKDEIDNTNPQYRTRETAIQASERTRREALERAERGIIT